MKEFPKRRLGTRRNYRQSAPSKGRSFQIAVSTILLRAIHQHSEPQYHANFHPVFSEIHRLMVELGFRKIYDEKKIATLQFTQATEITHIQLHYGVKNYSMLSALQQIWFEETWITEEEFPTFNKFLQYLFHLGWEIYKQQKL